MPIQSASLRFGAIYYLQMDGPVQHNETITRLVDRKNAVMQTDSNAVSSYTYSGGPAFTILTGQDAQQFWKDTYQVDLAAHQQALKSLRKNPFKWLAFAIKPLRRKFLPALADTQAKIDKANKPIHSALIDSDHYQAHLVGRYLAKYALDAKGKPIPFHQSLDRAGKPVVIETIA